MAQDILTIGIIVTTLLSIAWWSASLALCLTYRIHADYKLARALRADRHRFILSLNKCSYANLRSLASAMGIKTKGCNKEQLWLKVKASIA